MMKDVQSVTREQVEDLMFLEAELLDEWRLREWLALFTDDGAYYVPTTDCAPDASPDSALFYVADDRFRLEQRVERLLKRTAHAEFPRSKTRHLVSNVRIRSRGEQELQVGAAVITNRTKMGLTETYIGSYRYRIVAGENGLRIKEKRCLLDMDGLKPNGRISIIL
ncbi:p-cumate 2,3-dioxygenase beta subunit [Solimonas aquatica]|uniref:p-cumate 2,3-dioxygenase beta subunit n=1 Tax=Solimonas aquatica TaxID=489703 RepID=A0A1H9BFA4_9GAMM|nr:aromatic-ring-hydroxylating dioxygenase subunit beta [Solimonas aquatica]SEP87676.1 p-cumate 2,3-dioxygenase beta subunit [Solimonas aquatica]